MNGAAKATLLDTMAPLSDGPNSVFGGTALVIHAKEDDYKTACGVIQK